MKKIITLLVCSVMLGTVSAFASESAAEAANGEPSKWSKAGEEIGEAAKAVGDATVDSSKKAWDATKEGSKEAWDKTKEGSKEILDKTKTKTKELLEKGKAKVHDATAAEATETEKAGAE